MKQNVKEKRIIFAFSLIVAICIYMMAAPVTVKADEGFEMYAATPGVSLTAGDSADFDLFFSGLGETGEDVKLEVVDIPDGFSGYFKNGTYQVNKVHATDNKETSAATFSLSTEAEAVQGSHEIMLKATTDSGMTDTLKLEVTIAEVQAGESNFTASYPDQEGVTGTIFSYSTTVINNSLTNQNYNFSTNAPAGWTVTFASDDKQVSSLDVDAGASAGVAITVTPPDDVAAGTYPISCTATSAKETLTTDLNVKILGTYDLEVTTKDGNLALDGYADKASDVTLLVKNNGNIDLNNIQLTSQANDNWKVDFEQSTIDTLAAGEGKEIKAHITPGNNSITGDYVVDITAKCDNKTDTTELRVTVKTKTGWGIFAIVIIVAVFAGLYSVMKKYGRR